MKILVGLAVLIALTVIPYILGNLVYKDEIEPILKWLFGMLLMILIVLILLFCYTIGCIVLP